MKREAPARPGSRKAAGRESASEADQAMHKLDLSRRKLVHNLDWNLLKVFHLIASQGGVSRAAGVLLRQQPAVSLALKRLEDQLGTKLCHRGPSGFSLTGEGKEVADLCRSIFEGVHDLPLKLAKLTDTLVGQVRIQLVSNLVFPPLDRCIAIFHQQYPGMEFQVGVSAWRIVESMVLRSEVDVGIAPTRFFNSSLRYVRLCSEEHEVYCGRDHPMFGQTVIDLRELRSERFVLTGADEPDEITGFRLRYGLGQVVGASSEYLEEALRLVRNGVGLGFLPDAMARPLCQAKLLHAVAPAAEKAVVELYVITNPLSARSAAAQVFVDELHRQIELEPGEPTSNPRVREAQPR